MPRPDPIPELKRAAAAALATHIRGWPSAYDAAVLLGTQRARLIDSDSPPELRSMRRPRFTEAAQRRSGVLEGEPSAMLPAVSAALAERSPGRTLDASERSMQTSMQTPRSGRCKRPGAVDANARACETQSGTNVPLYPEWQAFLRERQPKTIIFWGQNDLFFTPEGGDAYLADLPSAEMHRLDAGHFVVEDHLEYVATHIRRFYAQSVATPQRLTRAG